MPKNFLMQGAGANQIQDASEVIKKKKKIDLR
jgi:hypothetical protein